MSIKSIILKILVPIISGIILFSVEYNYFLKSEPDQSKDNHQSLVDKEKNNNSDVRKFIDTLPNDEKNIDDLRKTFK